MAQLAGATAMAATAATAVDGQAEVAVTTLRALHISLHLSQQKIHSDGTEPCGCLVPVSHPPVTKTDAIPITWLWPPCSSCFLMSGERSALFDFAIIEGYSTCPSLPKAHICCIAHPAVYPIPTTHIFLLFVWRITYIFWREDGLARETFCTLLAHSLVLDICSNPWIPTT